MSKNLVMPDAKDLAQHGGTAIAGHLDRHEISWQEDGIAAADLPQPCGWRLLVEMIKVKRVTAGGIELPDLVTEAAAYERAVGLVCAVGANAYMHRKFLMFDAETKKDSPCQPWCRAGDWVVFGRYAGQIITMKGATRNHEFRFVNDDEVLAVAPRPEMLKNYVA